MEDSTGKVKAKLRKEAVGVKRKEEHDAVAAELEASADRHAFLENTRASAIAAESDDQVLRREHHRIMVEHKRATVQAEQARLSEELASSKQAWQAAQMEKEELLKARRAERKQAAESRSQLHDQVRQRRMQEEKAERDSMRAEYAAATLQRKAAEEAAKAAKREEAILKRQLLLEDRQAKAQARQGTEHRQTPPNPKSVVCPASGEAHQVKHPSGRPAGKVPGGPTAGINVPPSQGRDAAA